MLLSKWWTEHSLTNMKRIVFLLALVISMTSCSDGTTDVFESIDTPERTETMYEIEQQLLATGWEIYRIHCMCPDLTISDDIIDRLEEDNNDLSAVIDMVNYLSKQLVFGDTIEETDAWERWCELYEMYSSYRKESF